MSLAGYFRTMARNNAWSNHRLLAACAGLGFRHSRMTTVGLEYRVPSYGDVAKPSGWQTVRVPSGW